MANQKNQWVSWNGNKQYDFQQTVQVQNEQQIQKAVQSATKIKVLGNNFSSADISANVDTLLDFSKYNEVVSINQDTKEITVQAGATLEKVLVTAQACGWTIPCLPDIDKVTIGGALATGTHGTSGHLLAQYVSKFKVVLANGTVFEITNEHKEMDAFRVSLGVLGILSEITFKCVENYQLHLNEFLAKDDDWLANLPSYLAKHHFVRILWLPHTDKGYVILGDKETENSEFKAKKSPFYLKYRRLFSKILYKYTQHKPSLVVYVNKFLASVFFSVKKEHVGSLYDATVTKSRAGTMELSEWTVAYEDFYKLFEDLKKELNDSGNQAFAHIPMDIRFVKKDNAWLSNAFQKNIVTVGCVCRNASAADTYKAFEVMENVFLKYQGTPHWAKRHQLNYQHFEQLYPMWEQFVDLREKLDPTDKFLNPYLTTIFKK